MVRIRKLFVHHRLLVGLIRGREFASLHIVDLHKFSFRYFVSVGLLPCGEGEQSHLAGC